MSDEGTTRIRTDRRVASVAVTNPKHYAADPEIFEAIDGFRSIGANLGNAIRYVTRLGLKGGDNTVKRDAGAAMWYCLDLMAYLMESDEEDYVPPATFYAEFDPINYYTELKLRADLIEEALGFKLASDAQKRLVLASMINQTWANRELATTGTSDTQYREHVYGVLLSCAVVIEYARYQKWLDEYPASAGSMISPLVVKDIYKGSKSFQPSEDTYAYMNSFFVLTAARGLHTEGVQGFINWQSGDPDLRLKLPSF